MPAEAYALWTTPHGQESCRVWFTIFVGDDAPDDATLIEFQQTIFAQDRPIAGIAASAPVAAGAG